VGTLKPVEIFSGDNMLQTVQKQLLCNNNTLPSENR
jgi:hypothetical protein